MLCSVYKSSKRDETYLFITKRDDFSKVPETLLEMFGQALHIMTFSIAQKTQLGTADIDKVRQALEADGYYLQIPPPKENLLDEFKAQNKVKTTEQ